MASSVNPLKPFAVELARFNEKVVNLRSFFLNAPTMQKIFGEQKRAFAEMSKQVSALENFDATPLMKQCWARFYAGVSNPSLTDEKGIIAGKEYLRFLNFANALFIGQNVRFGSLGVPLPEGHLLRKFTTQIAQMEGGGDLVEKSDSSTSDEEYEDDPLADALRVGLQALEQGGRRQTLPSPEPEEQASFS
jgi:hypothetical protein